MKRILIIAAVVALPLVIAAGTKPKGPIYPYVLDPSTCTYTDGCRACLDICKNNSISEAKVKGKTILVIDPAKCQGEGDCFSVCPAGSLSKSKTVAPAPAAGDKAAAKPATEDKAPAK